MEVYNFQNMHKLFSISIANTPLTFALSPAPNSYFAHASSRENGTVQIYDLISTNLKTTLSAHKSPVMLMAFNQTGDLLATTSTNVCFIPVTLIGPHHPHILGARRDEAVLSEARSKESRCLLAVVRPGFILPRRYLCSRHAPRFCPLKGLQAAVQVCGLGL